MKRSAPALCALALALALLPSTVAGGEGVARIHLVFTNDIHGYVDPRGATFMNPSFPPPLGGGASAARYVQQLRQEIAGDPDAAILMLDAGDTWQGSPLGTLTEGRALETYFDEMGYDAIAPGNHEFDAGRHVPERMSAQMDKPFVACNIYEKSTGERVDWVEPCRVVEKAGLRIGIIGANTPGTEHMAFGANIEGLDFRPVAPEVQAVRDSLVDNDLADVVVLVVHEGLPFDAERGWRELYEAHREGEEIRVRGAMELAHVLEGIPVIVAGHTHRGYDEPWIHPLTHTMVFETFGNGSSIGHAVLEFDRATGQLLGYEAPRREGVLVTLFEDQWWPEPGMQAALAPYIDSVAEGLNEVVGESSVELTRAGRSNSVMGNFVTDAMRTGFGADLAFTNTGGLRTDLPRGNITQGDLMRLLPFGNAAVVVELDGRTIRELMESRMGARRSGMFFSGAEVVVDPEAPRGERVLELTIGGQPVEPDRRYRAVTSDYLMEGNSGMEILTTLPPERAEYTQSLLRDVVGRYLRQNSPVAPRIDDRYRENRDGPMAGYLRDWGDAKPGAR